MTVNHHYAPFCTAYLAPQSSYKTGNVQLTRILRTEWGGGEGYCPGLL